MHFRDRAEAGRFLATKLVYLAARPGLLVLALPRGGVPVGYEVARVLRAPLDVIVVRKLGVPGQKELAMGAIASGGTRVLNSAIIAAMGVGATDAVERATAIEMEELRLRETTCRGNRPFPDLCARTVVLVDDGLATGATMRAAARAVRLRAPAGLIIAVPVAAESSCRELEAEADEVICALTPEDFFGVGQFYHDFRQTTDEEVREYLAAAAAWTKADDQPNE